MDFRVFVNNPAKYNHRACQYEMNFTSRVKVSSIKNFQMIPCNNDYDGLPKSLAHTVI